MKPQGTPCAKYSAENVNRRRNRLSLRAFTGGACSRSPCPLASTLNRRRDAPHLGTWGRNMPLPLVFWAGACPCAALALGTLHVERPRGGPTACPLALHLADRRVATPVPGHLRGRPCA